MDGEEAETISDATARRIVGCPVKHIRDLLRGKPAVAHRVSEWRPVLLRQPEVVVRV